MLNDNPLVMAMKGKAPSPGDDPQKLLEFILAHFDLVPKKTEGPQENEETPVRTQESHSP